MGVHVTRPVAVTWDASPDAVASALSRAIGEQRYEDAGDDTVTSWRATGSVDGRIVDIRMTTVGAPGSSGYGIALDVRGELLDDGAGTRLRANASVPAYRWVLPLIAGMWVVLAASTALFVVDRIGPLAALVVFAVVLSVVWLLFTVLNGRLNGYILGAIPRVETVLARLGTPPATG